MLGIRESRDSDEHPTSRAVTLFLDVTGSNVQQAELAHAKLGKLMGTILRKGALEHPQLLFGGIGDATCDSVPLQIGQWESDNRIDETLEKLFLEGGGGGQKTESYELAFYAMARHTSMDCWEKRREPGYLFIVGDEMAYPVVSKAEVKRVFGETIQADIPTEQIIREAQERFIVYFIRPVNSSYGRDPEVRAFWKKLLGDNVIEIQDASDICELVAATIAAHEGLDVDDVLDDMGASAATKRSVSTALSAVTIKTGASGAIVKPEGNTSLVGAAGGSDGSSGSGRRL
jgi:hypothetical protein